jgi:hypothetical protein
MNPSLGLPIKLPVQFLIFLAHREHGIVNLRKIDIWRTNMPVQQGERPLELMWAVFLLQEATLFSASGCSATVCQKTS